MAVYKIPPIKSRWAGNGEWHWLTSAVTGTVYDVPCHHGKARVCWWCLARIPFGDGRYTGVSDK